MTPDITELIKFIQESGVLLVFKVLFLGLLGVFIIYLFVLISRIKTLNRTLYLHAAQASALVQLIAVILLFASISLFIITIVIV